MATPDELRARRRALLTAQDSPTLCHSLATIDSGTLDRYGFAPADAEQRMVCAWICDELESRYPILGPVMEAWVEDDDDDRTYSRVVLDTLATLSSS